MDVFTLIICTGLVALLMCGTTLSLFLASSKDKFLLFWLVSGVCFFCSNAMGFLALFFALPEHLFPALANAFFVAAHASLLSGTHQLINHKASWRLVLAVLFAVVAMHQFAFIADSFQNRIITLYPIIIALDGAALGLLWKHRKTDLGMSFWPLILAISLYMTQAFVRGAFYLVTDPSEASASATLLSNSGTLALLCLLFLLTIGFGVVVLWKKELVLRRRTVTDPLTGWLNRRALEPMAENEMAKYQRANIQFGFIVFDIDHFKAVNDSYGHAMGDLAIRHLCKIAQELKRGYDNHYRIGGEEFALLISDTNSSDLKMIAERIRASIEKSPFSHDGFVLNLTVSVGFSCVTRTDKRWQSVLHRADQALYRSKKSGRNCVKGIDHLVSRLV